VAHRDDLRFNRKTKGNTRQYLKDYTGVRVVGDHTYQGYIKCKLVHHQTYSIIIPDQVYLEIGGELRWIQPLYFSGCIVGQLETHGECRLGIDVSHGVLLNVQFSNQGLVSRLSDGSLFYRCEIRAPRYLYRYTTGPAKLIDEVPHIKLHHHSSREAIEGIEASGEFWSSNWNIQGSKKTNNISYLYMTALPTISSDEDLCEIAMSSIGRLGFRIDQNHTPIPDLILDVYRESTENRTMSLSYWVDSSLLATQPAYRHMIPGLAGYHEVVGPFIHRIGVESGTTVKITANRLSPCNPKKLDYVVVGDATTVLGLGAPYDEESTGEILKIENLKDDEDIISFWVANANTNQYDGKEVELAGFK
jgi:hypothetical protein